MAAFHPGTGTVRPPIASAPAAGYLQAAGGAGIADHSICALPKGKFSRELQLLPPMRTAAHPARRQLGQDRELRGPRVWAGGGVVGGRRRQRRRYLDKLAR
jgi:hypothetical protein